MVSAKTGDNIKHMFFSIVSELPFFEEFGVSNKNKLIQELEKENNDNMDTTMGHDKDAKTNGVVLDGETPKDGKVGGCKC